jgi:hypothetical protein
LKRLLLPIVAALAASVLPAQASQAAVQPPSKPAVQIEPSKALGLRVGSGLASSPHPYAALRALSSIEQASLLLAYPLQVKGPKTTAKPVTALKCGDKGAYGPCPERCFWPKVTYSMRFTIPKPGKNITVTLGQMWMKMRWCNDGINHSYRFKITSRGGWITYPNAEYTGNDKLPMHNLGWEVRGAVRHHIKFDAGPVHITLNPCTQIRGGYVGWLSRKSCKL